MADRVLAYLRGAVSDRIVPHSVQLAPQAGGIAITTFEGQQFLAADSVIIAVGPWIGELVPRLAKHLVVTRQVVGWFRPAQTSAVALGQFPIFILDGPHGDIYGFPDFEGRGIKAACHNLGPMVAPSAWGPRAEEEELRPAAQTLKSLIPGAYGPIVDREVCLYTNMLAGDADGSPEKEFVIDRLPEDRRIIIASPCSGHGFKFASAIGRDLADMATRQSRNADQAFRLSRFTSFAA